MQVFIANVTRATHIFSYRRPEVGKTIDVNIAPGHQIPISAETRPQLEAIVKQHSGYGLVEYTDAAKVPRFSGQCYRFDTPIPVRAMQDALEQRLETVDDRAQAMLEVSAVAAQSSIEDAAARVGLAGNADASAEVAVEQKLTPDERARGTTPIKQTLKTGVTENRDQKQRHARARGR